VLLDASIVGGIIPGMLKKVTLLIPLVFNDGTAVADSILDQIEAEIYAVFDGWTVAGEVIGAFKRMTGEKQVDRSMEVWVIVEETAIPVMKGMVAKFGGLLKQDAMYFEVSDYHVEFIAPSPKESQP
jgi:hypothetical protein